MWTVSSVGDIADMILEGFLDEETGEYIGDINKEEYGTEAPGFPISYERQYREGKKMADIRTDDKRRSNEFVIVNDKSIEVLSRILNKKTYNSYIELNEKKGIAFSLINQTGPSKLRKVIRVFIPNRFVGEFKDKTLNTILTYIGQ